MIFLSTLTIILACVVSSSDTTTIPLDQIWALEMPGAKDVMEISPVDTTLPTAETRKISPAHDIAITLNKRDEKRKHIAGSGFVVVGTDRQALEKARNVITGKSKADKQFAFGKELTLVYFTKATGRNIYIGEITHEGSVFTIRYFTHGTVNMGLGSNFALIPIGKLSAGQYSVKFRQSAPSSELGIQPRTLSAIDIKRLVCDSFNFSVKDSLPGD